jgi:hypothetical protein
MTGAHNAIGIFAADGGQSPQSRLLSLGRGASIAAITLQSMKTPDRPLRMDNNG